MAKQNHTVAAYEMLYRIVERLDGNIENDETQSLVLAVIEELKETDDFKEYLRAGSQR